MTLEWTTHTEVNVGIQTARLISELDKTSLRHRVTHLVRLDDGRMEWLPTATRGVPKLEAFRPNGLAIM